MIDARFDFFRPCRHRLFGAAAVGVLLLAYSGCGGAEGGVAPKTSGVTPEEGITHEPCAGAHTEALDTNGDGKPDIERVLDGAGHEQCRIVDLNHDGKPDLYEYFDASGAVRRREFCYDDTGAVNAIETYEGGKLAKREYDVSGQHRIDTWDWFDPNAPADAKTGRPAHPVRRERDTTGNGRVDQWWTWNADKVTIAVDRTGDGKPDPDATLTLGGASGAASGTGGVDGPPSTDAGGPNTPSTPGGSVADGGSP
jgi:hypothetical protein